MSLTYLAPGGVFDAEKANSLYADFERKVGLILSHKSPFLAVHIRPGLSHLFGRVVHFVSGFQAYTGAATTHDEAVYDAAVAAATVSSWDDTLHIANCSETIPDIDDSLIVRTVEHLGIPYYLKQTLNRQEKRHPFGVLDVVVEGPTTLAFPATWDKYGCVRLHNCNLQDGLDVTFAGTFPESETTVVVTVPRGECKTVRIDRDAAGVPTAVVEEGRYFWMARPTDPFPVGAKNWTYYPESSYRASNILNPRLALAWIEALKTPDIQTELGWEIDETVLQDVEDTYRTTYYADPEASGTILGDLIHHKGSLSVDRTAMDQVLVPFNGYGVPLGSLIEIVSDGSGGFTLQRTDTDVTYVSGVTTNILENGIGAHGTVSLIGGAAVNLSKPVLLVDPAQAARWPSVYPGDTDPFELVIHTATTEIEVTADWVDGSDVPHTVTGTFDQFTGTPESPVVYEFTAGQTVAALDAVSPAMQLTTAALTPLGPTFVFDRPLDVSLPGWVWHPEQQALRLKDHGWPTWDFDNNIEGVSPPIHRHVLWPRPPQVVRPFGVDDPPDATGLGDTQDGAPWAVSGVGVRLPMAFTSKRFLMPLGDMASEGDTLAGGWWRAWSWESNAIRVPRTCEEWNWLAWRVNQLKRGRPLSLGDIRFTVDGGVASLTPLPRSYTDPVDYFCAAEATGSTQEALFALYGISYATFSDYPARWLAINSDFPAGGIKHITTPTLPVTNSTPVKSWDGSAWRVDWTESYGAPYAAVAATSGELMVDFNTTVIDIDIGASTYRWVSDGMAIALAGAVGVPMIRTLLCRGQKVVTENPQAPTLLWETHDASQAREYTGMANEWEADALIATIPPTDVILGGALSEYRYGEHSDRAWDGATMTVSLPAQTEGDVDFVIPVIYDDVPMPGDRVRENLAVKFDADGITKTGSKSEFYSAGTRVGVAAWQTTRTTDWWRLFAGSHQTMLAVTTFSDGFGLKSYSRAGLTPSYLFDRAVPANTSEAEHDRLVSLYGVSDPRVPTYIPPAVGEAAIVTWTGKLKVLGPPGTAKSALIWAELIVGVDLEYLGD